MKNYQKLLLYALIITILGELNQRELIALKYFCFAFFKENYEPKERKPFFIF